MTKKVYFYVLVITDSGPVFVTSADFSNHTAVWDKDEKPKSFSSTVADEVCLGLNCNYQLAYVVRSSNELEVQPYRYEAFDFVLKERGESSNE